MDRCALFVDAGYLLADGAMAVHGTRHRDSVSWDFGGLLQLLGNLARERTGLPLLRCYWYESTVEGRRSLEHEALADLPGLKLRVGRIRPGRREGVDSEIHRDLMTLARNGAVAEAVLVSGDEELCQVVTDAQDLGVRVTVLHVAADGNWTISRSLRQECDDLIEVGAGQLRPYVSLLAGIEAPATTTAGALGPGPSTSSSGYEPAKYDASEYEASKFDAAKYEAAKYEKYDQGASSPAPVSPLSNGHGSSTGSPGRLAAAGSPGGPPPSSPLGGPPSGSGYGSSGGGQGSSSSGYDGKPSYESSGYDGSGYDGSRYDGGSSSGYGSSPGSGSGSGSGSGYTSGSGSSSGYGSGSIGGYNSSTDPGPGNGSAPHLPPPSSTPPSNGSGGPGGPGQTLDPLPRRRSTNSHNTGSHNTGSHSTNSHGTGSQSAPSPLTPPPSPLHAAPTATSQPGTGPQYVPQPPARPPSAPPALSPPPSALSPPPSAQPRGPYTGPQQLSPVPAQQAQPSLADAVKAAHKEGQDFGESVARDAPALWLEAVLARKPRMPSDLEARLLQGSSLPIDFLLHDEVRHALRRGFWDALERSRR